MSGQRKAEAGRWFQQASYDLQAARWNTEGGFHDTACFIAQQAGEKALKSLLYYLGSRRTALTTHSILRMIEEAQPQVSALSDVLEAARELDLHYIPSRYPNGLPSGYPHKFYGKDMAAKAVIAADKILATVREHYEQNGETDILEGTA